MKFPLTFPNEEMRNAIVLLHFHGYLSTNVTSKTKHGSLAEDALCPSKYFHLKPSFTKDFYSYQFRETINFLNKHPTSQNWKWRHTQGKDSHPDFITMDYSPSSSHRSIERKKKGSDEKWTNGRLRKPNFSFTKGGPFCVRSVSQARDRKHQKQRFSNSTPPFILRMSLC